MTSITTRLAVLFTVLAFTGMIAAPASAYAGKTPVEIKVRVSEKGFTDEKGIAYTAKRPLKVPQGMPITITFVFSEAMTSMAIGDTHQIALRSEAGAVGETDKIWVMNQEASLTFLAGENGQTHYRAYCILDCIGMEHLTNLLIQVVAA